jgi:hypothetical protein
MREAFAHDAVVVLAAEGDDRAPGGAITVALCGKPSHEPPCPLAPHHTGVTRSGREATLRVLFACDAHEEDRVRGLIDEALARGWGEDPEGVRTHWDVVSTGSSPVRPAEREHAARLTEN